MTPDRYQQVKNTLADALDLPNEQLRSAFLSEACAEDTSLRREVESLLAQKEDDQFEDCAQAVGENSKRGHDAANEGRRVGAYELVRELGRGGMGAVWLARRADQQFEKLVAIKLLKRGTDTDEVLRRFYAERQILARLEHPNIARLIDGGTTDDDLPYFVMESVEGARVTDYCLAQNLSIADRLRLFRKICGAVQFAHQNLVVHRDLKPANILVTADGEPKLLDFGIAKLLATEEDNPEVTLAGGERLTPAYASPEQVRGEPVTTISDVYALGALLYQILTDVSPHRFSNTRPAPNELLRVICEEDPVRPSLAVREPELRRRLRGDLDTIVARAMSKDPERRYRSAGNLADDLRRYLEHRPVRARPDTFAYRARKFIGRNKIGVAAAALLALAVSGGVAGIAWEAQRAHRRFDDVRHLANSYLFEFDDAIENLPGSTPARRLIVGRALKYLDDLAQEAGGDRQLQLELADAYLKVGDVQGKPYTANLGDTSGAVRSYENAIRIAEPLAARERGQRSSEARRVLAQAHENLGVVYCRLNHVETATRNHERALAIAEKVLSENQGTDEWKRVVVRNRLGLGDAIMAGNHLHADVAHYRAALDHYRQALPLCEQLVAADPQSAADSYRLMQTCARIAAMLSEIGADANDNATVDEAFAFHQRTLALDEAALRKEPENATFRRNYAGELIMTAYAKELAKTDLDAASDLCRRALEIDTALAAADPNNSEARQNLGHDYYVTGRAAQLRGDKKSANENYKKSIAILESLTAAHPDNVETAYDLARARKELSEIDG
ncbi:MAG: protein kinase domain-containing protein [Chthoniobacterales bacterium]